MTQAWQRLASAVLPALLAACASTEHAPPVAGPAAARTDAKLAGAVIAPLTDLNLVRGEIPPVLVAAHKAPYAPPADNSCAGLKTEVEALDAALGADLDTPVTAANPSLLERGQSAAGDAVISAVRSTTEGVIPFRGWVRKLTGAERYAREVQAAITAGSVRRGYLKGLGDALHCEAPVAPRK